MTDDDDGGEGRVLRAGDRIDDVVVIGDNGSGWPAGPAPAAEREEGGTDDEADQGDASHDLIE